ncbi:uncharacterized protein BP5553_00358 [Venustampulla echinocandica]|uniref:Uncharacterized protein n=1 Tax=Venustampulla echinocandica TaxID=2656787 RepID=A0A370TXY4_9HELO|nr:uncharacterized protein BP5553_00358 [Venustampulla echinocandica]RDL40379.1 hypothetical protein BP5553_00358 [Venustampulla echinocandica]
MGDWLRPVFGRARTGSTSSFERSTSPRKGGSCGTEGSKLSLSRVSSYLGLRPRTPPVPQFLGLDSFQGTRNPENVYHMPSTDQMAETLKVVMMNKCPIEAVPIEYNACILHVLEAYQDLREQLKTTTDAIEELKQSHTKDIKEFEALATRWEAKEKDYKSELKKLEVLLSRTEAGMETVVMARSNSVIHGSGRATEAIEHGINSIKASHAARHPQDDTEPHKPGAPFDRRNRNIYTPRPSRSQLEAMDRKDRERVLGLGSDSSSSSLNESSFPSQHRDSLSIDKLHSLGIATDDNPLPHSPPTSSYLEAQLRMDTPSPKQRLHLENEFPGLGPRPGQMSFSFQPGDDAHILTPAEAMELAKSNRLKGHVRQRKLGNQNKRLDTLNQNSPNTRGAYNKNKPNPVKTRSTLSNHQTNRRSDEPSNSANSNRTKLEKPQPLTRNNSGSSIVTAICHNSGPGSAAGSRPESRNSRPHPDRQVTRSEAITAALRAFGGNRRGLGLRKKSSGPVAGEDIQGAGKPG